MYDKPFSKDDHEAVKMGMPVMGQVAEGRVVAAK